MAEVHGQNYRKWERFTGLNFRVFHDFQEYRESFREYKYLSLIVLNNEHLWPRQCESISVKTSMGLKPRIFSPANFSPSAIFHQAHGGVFVVHLGDAKVYSKMLHHYWWPKM